MNLTHLHTFVAVVDAGSFSRASQQMGVSQPAITMQIRGLEEELGQQLLDRKYRRLDLTEAGVALLPFARRMLATEAEARDGLSALTGVVGGQLLIAASTTPGDYVIPPLLGDFVRAYPKVQVSIAVSSTSATVDVLDAVGADFGIVGAEVKNRKVEYEVCGHDELVPVCPAVGELAAVADEVLKVTDLAKLPWVMRNEDSGTQRVVDRLLEAGGLEVRGLNAMVKFDTGEAVVAGVEGGLGIAVVSRYVAARSLALGTLRELALAERPWTRPFYLAYPHKSLSRAAEAFVAFLKKRLN